MKILVINGSPKKDKSDTMHITRAFLDGMNDVTTNDVNLIHVMDKNINFCTGCLSCMKDGGVCIHDDDMKDILEEILSSDILLFSFPLYSYGMPAPLKSLIDRLLPLSSISMKNVSGHYEHILKHDVSELKFIMICGSGFPNREDNFEPAVMQFNRMFRGNNTVITISEAPMFNSPEAEVVTKPFLELVSIAGREYAYGKAVSPETMAKLQEPMIPYDVYAMIVNGGFTM